MATGTPFNPYTEADLYSLMIIKKRDLIATESLKWTSEMPTDPGIASLRCSAHVSGLLSEQFSEWTKQNYIIYAVADMAVHATTRALGYKIKGSLPAKFLVTITTSGAQTISIGTKLTKETSDGVVLKFETLEDVTFTGAGAQNVYVLQGETHTAATVADGTEFQEIVINDFPVAFGSVVFINDGNIWAEVEDYIDSTPVSKHFVVEYDHTGQPTIITGDGEFGAKPASGTISTVAWRTCDGLVGNLAPGDLEFEVNFANVTSVTNEAPVKGELYNDTNADAATIYLVDDDSINGFLDSGLAYIGEDSFSYTGKVANSFTGCTGLEEPHLAGEEVVYSISYTYGANRETNKQAKVSAIRFNRTKGSAKSLLDYQYFAEQVPGVVRARATNSNNVITIQIIPSDGGIPSSTLLDTVYTYLALRKGATDTISVINPVYVYIDVKIEISAAAGHSFLDTVKPAALSEIQDFFDPMVKTEDNFYYINGWGNLLIKSLLEARIFYMADETLVADATITQFKRSTSSSGSSNIQLDVNEVAHIGNITITDKNISMYLAVGEASGPSGINTLPSTAVDII